MLGASVLLLCVVDMDIIHNGTQNYWLGTLNNGNIIFQCFEDIITKLLLLQSVIHFVASFFLLQKITECGVPL